MSFVLNEHIYLKEEHTDEEEHVKIKSSPKDSDVEVVYEIDNIAKSMKNEPASSDEIDIAENTKDFIWLKEEPTHEEKYVEFKPFVNAAHKIDNHAEIMNNAPVASDEIDFKENLETTEFIQSKQEEKMPPKHSLNLEIDTDKNKKRSRKSVTLETKLEVLRRIEAGDKIVQICNAMGLAKSTVQTIRDRKKEIKTHSLSAAPLSVSKLTRQRSSIMEKMEKLLDMWIEDNNQRRMPMTQIAIQEKAKSIFENLKREDTDVSVKDVTFQGSRGWFEKFKIRHDLHNFKIKGERARADDGAAKEYPKTLKKIIERGGYRPEQVFNVDETGLYWKRLPESTYISKYEKSASEFKTSKERLTLLLGANAAGDFKLKPLLVYLSENPTCFEGLNMKQLPVIWRSNKHAWMTKIIFEDWFKNYFCPQIKQYLKDNNLSNRALLILDNAPGHPVNLSELSEDMEIEYLPKNTTALIQPMDQGAIATFKAYYLRRIFCKLIPETDGECPIEQFWKNYSIRDAVDNISESWKELKSTTMNHAWEKIWPECIKTKEPKYDYLSEIRQNILILANNLGFNKLKEGDLIDFLDADREPLSNEELIQLETEQTLDEEPDRDIYQTITDKHLTNALFYFELGMNILRQNDPDEERSTKMARKVNSAISCYKRLQKETENKTTLDHHFKLGAKNDDGGIL